MVTNLWEMHELEILSNPDGSARGEPVTSLATKHSNFIAVAAASLAFNSLKTKAMIVAG